MWLEDPLYALMNSGGDRLAMEVDTSNDRLWAVVVRKDVLVKAREKFGHLSVRQSLERAGVKLDRMKPDDISLQFDELYHEALANERDGNSLRAAEMYEYIAQRHKNELWMKAQAARSFYKAGEIKRAMEYCLFVNEKKPTVDTLLTEAQIWRSQGKYCTAINLLERAEEILEGKQLIWT